MATERAATRPTRSITDLQRDAPGIVREARERGEVEIRRYGETVAFLVSPGERERAHKLERFVERAMVAMEYKRAMEDWEAGNVVEWEEVETDLRGIVNKK